MVVQVVTPPPAPTPAPYKVKAKPVTQEYLSGPGILRVQHLMHLFDCSQSAVYRKIKGGHLPAPTGGDPRPWWSNEVIRKHLAGATK
jgi:predicted DNA-binding transcriptional regulator AlpA